VLKALSKDTHSAVDAGIAYYPSCRTLKPWKSVVPVLVLFGENDDVVSLDKCKQTFSHLPYPGVVELHTYPDAVHAFDFKGLPEKAEYPFGTIGYDDTAATAAWNALQRFAKR